jgi:phosphoribosylglycinamide formyltransferase-1
MSKKISVAVFASGRGSNFDALAKYPANHYQIACLVSDQPKAGAISLAHQYQIPSLVFSVPKNSEQKKKVESEIVSFLRFMKTDLVVLAGYMRLIGSPLLEAFGGKMINIHPSLLPLHPGLHAIEKSFSSKTGMGISIHWVDAGMDTGTLIKQEPVIPSAQDDLSSFEDKVHALEHQLYPQIVDQIAHKNFLV